MPAKGSDYAYDVFISYSHTDKKWVLGWLLPQLEAVGLRVCIDFRDFDIGVPGLVNMERAVDNSRHTLLVLTRAWVASEWTEFEQLLTQTRDPAARRRRLLPLLLQPCQPPSRITMLTYADFTWQEAWEAQLQRVIAAVRGELRLPDVGPQLSQVAAPGAAPFLVPFLRNPDFVGREEDMIRLHEMIYQGDSPVGIRPTVLVGLRGIGKTQLAVEYAHAHRDDYPSGIFWLNAVNPLLHEFADLAETLGLADKETSRERAAYRAWAYLDARPDALVIFDNIEEPANLNVPFAPGLIPGNLRCCTLFTTWQRDFPRNFQAFEVAVLPELPAMRLLLRARPEVLEEHHPEWGVARIICASLGWLPLALELAAAYLKEYDEVTLEGYLERLRTEGKLTTIDDTDLRPEDLPTRHEVAVAATLRAQWSRLDDDDARLLFRTAGQFSEASWIPTARLGLLAGIEAEAGPGHPSRLTRALRRLRAVSLIEELTGDRLRLHPLVHEFAAKLTQENERETFRLELETNVVKSLEDPAYHHERAVIAGECLLRLGWSPLKMRPAVLEALRELMWGKQIPEQECRNAAFLLTHLDWLADAQSVSPDEMVLYLELIGRFVDSPAQRHYLVRNINSMLASEAAHLSDRHRIQLLVYRAINYGYLGELDRAERDYEMAKPLIRKLIDSKYSQMEDHKMSARVDLGLGNVARKRAEKLIKLGDLERGQEGLRRAVDLYLTAAKSAQVYGQDAILEATAYKELGYAYTLLQNWTEAKESYRNAFEVLKTLEEREAYEVYYARILEAASQMHFEKGRSLTLQQYDSQALLEYETAYKLAQDEIATLEKSYGESDDLALAHINAGDYLLGMSACPSCPVPDPLAEACAHWRIALNMACRLGISDLEQEAKERLEQHC